MAVASLTRVVLTVLASLGLMVLMVTTVIDVAGRYLFNAPLHGAYEISELTIGIVAAAALPVVTYNKAHLRLDITDAMIGRVGRRIRGFVTFVLMVAATFMLGWQVRHEALSAWQFDSRTDLLQFPKVYVLAFIAAMFLLSAVAAVLTYLAPEKPIAGGAIDSGTQGPSADD